MPLYLASVILFAKARIIAMTCTHAALIRRKLVELGFKYDNMVMEESAQILEVETFIPMMLQVNRKMEPFPPSFPPPQVTTASLSYRGCHSYLPCSFFFFFRIRSTIVLCGFVYDRYLLRSASELFFPHVIGVQ